MGEVATLVKLNGLFIIRLHVSILPPNIWELYSLFGQKIFLRGMIGHFPKW